MRHEIGLRAVRLAARLSDPNEPQFQQLSPALCRTARRAVPPVALHGSMWSVRDARAMFSQVLMHDSVG